VQIYSCGTTMSVRIVSTMTIAALFTAVLSGCGGGGSSSGGSGSTGTGGGGASGLLISTLAPSSVTLGILTGAVTVLGQGFTQQSQVLIDGQPAPQTFFTDANMLQAETNISLSAAVGTHQFSVQNGGQVSNSLTYTVYAPQQGPFVMQAIPGFLVGENASDPPFIVAEDVNGDGLADVIMPGPVIGNSASVAILNGQSDGSLSTTRYIQVSTTPYTLVAGDVDGNGTPDLVSITSTDSISSTVSVLFGDGHGNFQQPVTQQTFPGIYPGPAYLADLDGDGKPDLVLAVEQPGGGSLVWLKNTGSGFAGPITLASIAGDNRHFSIADFNGDGKPDIQYILPGTSSIPESVHILINQGNGIFNDQAAGGLNGIVGFTTVLDFNLDGIPDLAVQVSVQNGVAYQLYSFAGTGNGSFTQVGSVSYPRGPIFLVTGDFDHDGFPDLAGPGGTEPSELVYFFGDGHGNFVVQNVVGPAGQFVAVGDFNGDGIPDLVVPDRFNFVSLALGRKDRNFPSPLALTPAVVGHLSTGDINGDGLPEIFSGGDSVNGIPGTVFLNEGSGSFQFAANTSNSTFMVADLTGKGVVDLLGVLDSDLEIWPNNKSLDFSSSMISVPVALGGPFMVADMDGDGCPDIVALGQVLYGDCKYQFTAALTPVTFSAPYVIGNFNGTGKLDIATGGMTLMNMGGRVFQEIRNSLPLTNGALAVVGDFNVDGKDDVAINLPGDTGIAIYYSNGDGIFYEGTDLDPGQYPGALAVADFNSDGRPDLAVGLMLSNQGCLLFNSGQGQFTRSFFASGAFAVAMTSSDLNLDGKPDLIIGNFMFNYAPSNINVVFHQ
jgi:FG-GAP-like repeat/FG-GAP repeat